MQTIELQRVDYSKEEVGDLRRWFALPVLMTGAFLPSLFPGEQGRALGFYAAIGSPSKTRR